MLDLILFIIRGVSQAVGSLFNVQVYLSEGDYIPFGAFFVFFIVIFLFIKFIKILSNKSVSTVKSNGGK